MESTESLIGDRHNILWKNLHDLVEKDDVTTSHIRVIVVCYKDKDGGLKWRPPEKGELKSIPSLLDYYPSTRCNL